MIALVGLTAGMLLGIVCRALTGSKPGSGADIGTALSWPGCRCAHSSITVCAYCPQAARSPPTGLLFFGYLPP
jgi:hypothetical protein